MPSPSNPKMFSAEESASDEIGCDELLTTPIRVSSTPSYGVPLLGPFETDTPPEESTVMINAQPVVSRPIAGHGSALVTALAAVVSAGMAAIAPTTKTTPATTLVIACRRRGTCLPNESFVIDLS